MFTCLGYLLQGCGHESKPFFHLSCHFVRLGEIAEETRDGKFCPRGVENRQALTHLRQSLFFLPFSNQCPTSTYGPYRQPKREPLLMSECDQFLCQVSGGWPLSNLVMQKDG